jgi:hypothetical protein
MVIVWANAQWQMHLGTHIIKESLSYTFMILCCCFAYTGQDGLVVPLHLILTVQLWVQFPS